jgi:hypothetical protein
LLAAAARFNFLQFLHCDLLLQCDVLLHCDLLLQCELLTSLSVNSGVSSVTSPSYTSLFSLMRRPGENQNNRAQHSKHTAAEIAEAAAHVENKVI